MPPIDLGDNRDKAWKRAQSIQPPKIRTRKSGRVGPEPDWSIRVGLIPTGHSINQAGMRGFNGFSSLHKGWLRSFFTSNDLVRGSRTKGAVANPWKFNHPKEYLIAHHLTDEQVLQWTEWAFKHNVHYKSDREYFIPSGTPLTRKEEFDFHRYYGLNVHVRSADSTLRRLRKRISRYRLPDPFRVGPSVSIKEAKRLTSNLVGQERILKMRSMRKPARLINVKGTIPSTPFIDKVVDKLFGVKPIFTARVVSRVQEVRFGDLIPDLVVRREIRPGYLVQRLVRKGAALAVHQVGNLKFLKVIGGVTFHLTPEMMKYIPSEVRTIQLPLL